MTRRWRWAILAPAWMLACREPATSAVQPGPRAPAEAAPGPSRSGETSCTVVALGDSLTSGMGEAARVPYTAFLERRLQAGGHHCRVINEGLPGDTAAKGVGRTQAVLRWRPSWVIVALGGNDGLLARDIADIERDLSSIVEKLVEAKVRVVVAGVHLPGGFDREYARRFHEIYPHLAERYRVPLVASLVEGLGEAGLVQEDGIHPTLAGNERMAANVERVLIPLLGEGGGGRPRPAPAGP